MNLTDGERNYLWHLNKKPFKGNATKRDMQIHFRRTTEERSEIMASLIEKDLISVAIVNIELKTGPRAQLITFNEGHEYAHLFTSKGRKKRKKPTG